MDLREGSKASILKQMAKYHGMTVTDPALWQFSAVVIDNPALQEDARVKLTPEKHNTKYRGSNVFPYKRLDLPSIGASAKVINFDVTAGDTVHQHFPDILKALGVLFDATDLEPTPFVAIEGSGAFTMTLTAKPGSYGWYGTTSIRVEPFQHISLYVNSPSFTWNQQQ